MNPAPTEPLVLVAEDDDEMRLTIGRALRRDPYRLVLTPDAVSLLARIDALEDEGAPYHLVVSDVRMPQMSGVVLVRALRARGVTVPVVLVSAFASPELRLEAAAAGTTHLMSKPFDLDDLRTVVMTLLYGRGHFAPAPQPSGRNALGRAR